MKVDAVDEHLALRGGCDARKHVEQRCLARARRTHDANKPALALREVDVSEANGTIRKLELKTVDIE